MTSPRTRLRVVSGGQTGVDRAALEVALELGLACGGWCPRGRRAEDGRIPTRYPLRETPRMAYAERTEWNVRDADATLVLSFGTPDGGTALTLRLARRLGRPWCHVDLAATPDPAELRRWLRERRVRTLNVAGPRESRARGIGRAARAYLRRALASAG